MKIFSERSHRTQTLVAGLLILLLAGCEKQSVPGGTEGVVHAGSTRMMDIQIDLYDASLNPVGFGISGIDGAFQLRRPGAAGPLWLAPGEYRATIQSVGAIPLVFPKDYTHAATTSLIVRWSAEDRVLDLEIPLPQYSSIKHGRLQAPTRDE